MRLHFVIAGPSCREKKLPHSPRKEILLPELVLDCTSEPVELDTNLFLYMPQDSSFVQRRYKAPDGFQTLLNVVLMNPDQWGRFCAALDDPAMERDPRFATNDARLAHHAAFKARVSMRSLRSVDVPCRLT